MNLILANIYKKCEALSSFEGRNITDGEGETAYQTVHITQQDKPFIYRLVRLQTEEAGRAIRSCAGELVLDEESAETESSGDSKIVEELVATGVIASWLEDKSAERSSAYRNMFYNMAQAIRGRIRPRLDTEY